MPTTFSIIIFTITTKITSILLTTLMERRAKVTGDAGCQIYGKEAADWFVIKLLKSTRAD